MGTVRESERCGVCGTSNCDGDVRSRGDRCSCLSHPRAPCCLWCCWERRKGHTLRAVSAGSRKGARRGLQGWGPACGNSHPAPGPRQCLPGWLTLPGHTCPPPCPCALLSCAQTVVHLLAQQGFPWSPACGSWCSSRAASETEPVSSSVRGTVAMPELFKGSHGGTWPGASASSSLK